MSEHATETGPLTREQAVELLTERPVEAQAPEAPVEAAEEPEEIEGEASAPEEPEAEAENLAEEEGEAEDAEEPEKLDAPLYWKPEAKAVFDAMTPEQQAVVLAQESPREEATQKAKAQAAAEVQKAQQEAAGVQALAAQLNEFLPQAIQTFNQRWGEPDWAAVAQEHGADQAFVLKVQYENEQKQLAQVQHAAQTAQAEARKAFLRTEWTQLEQIAPELTDPDKGQAARSEVIKYLNDDGIPKDATDQISAREMLIARKAMLWDRAQAALKAPKTPKPAALAAPRAPVRPVAAAAQPSSPQRDAQRIQNRFAQTGSREDAVALIVAKGL
jgi:hypothetical protein